MQALRSHSPRFLQATLSPTKRSPSTKATPQSVLKPTPALVSYRRDARFCVHADTNNNLSLYPNMLFDPSGDLVISQRAGTFEMASLVQSQVDRISRAGTSAGLLLSYNPNTKDPTKHIRLGTFFQVSPTRAIAAYHTCYDGNNKVRELWVSKSCSITHWPSLFQCPHSRGKYFRQIRVVRDFDEERARLLPYYGEGLVEKSTGLAPRVPIDIAILELTPDFRDDPYLQPIPKAKLKTVKKVGVIAYNQREVRDENNRASIYSLTAGIPVYDQEPKYLHYGNKSISPGLLVGNNDAYIASEVSLGEGSAGGPLIPLTLAHYFWGIQTSAFYDAEPAAGVSRSRNFNVALNFYHPAVLILYEKFVLPTLPETEQHEIRTSCYA